MYIDALGEQPWDGVLGKGFNQVLAVKCLIRDRVTRE